MAGKHGLVTSTDENALRIFERKIYGPVLENGEFRIRYNEELNELIKGEDIRVRFIKTQRLQWLCQKGCYKVKYIRQGREEDPGWDGWRMCMMIFTK
jgi:hypothetical protein